MSKSSKEKISKKTKVHNSPCPEAAYLRGKKKNSKLAMLLSLLRRPKGTTIDEMTKATGWQSHTVRSFISGMVRKKLKLTVSCEKNESDARIYRIVEA